MSRGSPWSACTRRPSINRVSGLRRHERLHPGGRPNACRRAASTSTCSPGAGRAATTRSRNSVPAPVLVRSRPDRAPPSQGRSCPVPPRVPGRHAADRPRRTAATTTSCTVTTGCRAGSAGRPRGMGRAPGRVVPHAGQGQELLPVARRASGAPGPPRRRGAVIADADRIWSPRRRPRRRSSSACTEPSPPHPHRPPRRRPRALLPLEPERGQGDGSTCRDLRLLLFVGRLQRAQGPGRRGADGRRGDRPRSRR